MGKLISVLALLVLAVPHAYGQTPEDTTAIRQAALDYVEGWFTGSAERMDKALHPDLIKRIVVTHPETGRSMLNQVTESIMVEATRAGAGSRGAPAELNVDVQVLDIYGDMAAVKTVAPGFIDYLQLAKWNDEWVIVNVLWSRAPR